MPEYNYFEPNPAPPPYVGTDTSINITITECDGEHAPLLRRELVRVPEHSELRRALRFLCELLYAAQLGCVLWSQVCHHLGWDEAEQACLTWALVICPYAAACFMLERMLYARASRSEVWVSYRVDDAVYA